MKFGSLFSGIGGFDLGFERAGMTCRWQAELDRQASTVLTRHWPGVKKYRHVESINYRTGKAYRRYHKPEAVDLICGGFPCQDVSVAGKRAGLAGGRSGLWFEFHRILSQSHPEWVVIENVPGLLSSNGGRDFAVILRGLVELGYGVAWRVLDAQYFGVAQRRRRVFIVGHIGDGRAAEILFEREGGAGDIAPSRQAGKDVADTIGTSADRVSGRAGALAPALAYGGNNTAGPIDVASAQTAHPGGRYDFESETFVVRTLRGEGHDASEDGTGRGVPMVVHETGKGFWTEGLPGLRAQPGGMPENLVMQADPMVSESRYARNGRGAPDTLVPPLKAENGQSGKGDGAPLVVGFTPRRTNAGAIDELSPTMNTGNGGFGAPGASGSFGVRRLMPVECERLQGFPDDWTAGQPDSPRYKQLGNAVEVDCAEWIGRRIMQATP